MRGDSLANCNWLKNMWQKRALGRPSIIIMLKWLQSKTVQQVTCHDRTKYHQPVFSSVHQFHCFRQYFLF